MQVRHLLAAGALAAACGAAFLVLRGGGATTDEDRIRAAIARMAAASERRDVGGILEHVSLRYRGREGGRDELKRMLLGILLRSDHVAVVVSGLEVRIEGERAEVRLVALMARGPAGAASGGEGLAGAHRIEATFEREGSDWRVVAASRREAEPADWVR